jgi:T4 superinfection immunity protein
VARRPGKTHPGEACSRALSRRKWNEPALDRDDLVLLLIASIGAAAAACVYALPAILAAYRRHPRSEAVAVLNLLLGWTVLGWIAALLWALWASRR